MVAAVANANGVVPTDLTQENFRVVYKGHATKPLRVAYNSGPRRVVVLLDVSGSVSNPSQSGTWEVARDAAWELVSALPEGSRTSLMTFSEKVEIRAPLSPDRKPILDWLVSDLADHPERLHGRGTALYAAIQFAVAQLQPAEPGDAVYVITDAGENASRVRESKIEDTLRSSGVRLFALMIPTEDRTIVEARVGSAELWQLSKNSGGFAEMLSLRGLALVFGNSVPYDDFMKEQIRIRSQRLSREIAAFYCLTLRLPENPQRPQRLDVRIVDDRGSKREDLLLAYPNKVSDCRAEISQR